MGSESPQMRIEPLLRLRPVVRWAWAPIPLLLLATLVAWLFAPPDSYPADALSLVLQLIFTTLASALVAYLLVRSFFASGNPALLLLACGIALWGLSGVAAGAFSRGDVNQSITIHNLCVWLSATCHLFAALLSARVRPAPERPWWLLGGFTAVLIAVAAVMLAGVNDWLPTFFVQGAGGTLVRQALLNSAIAMFVFSAFILGGASPRLGWGFSRWYRFGLLLIAVGLFGVSVQPALRSVVGWTGVSAQWLGGAYLVIAALAASRESHAAEISLVVAPHDVRLRYGLAVVFVAAASAVRLLFFQELGVAVPYILFFPAVMLTALYAGAGPAVLAATLAIVVSNFLWVEPLGSFDPFNPERLQAAGLFYLDCLVLIVIARAMRRAQTRAIAAEAESSFAQRSEQTLREADRRKDAFLATLSHEVRNALAPMSNSLEIIERARSDQFLAERARVMMRQQMTYLNRIVDDLLDISRITRDKLALRFAPTDIVELVRLSIEANQPLAEHAGHGVKVTLPLGSLFVNGDSIRLAQVFVNLLNNACKYTEAPGHIELSARRDGHDAVISVKDDGIGISPEMMPRVFEPFTQIDQSLARSQGGLGIGLSLAKRLVEMHGGTLSGFSAGLGRGSEFVVRLPALAAALPAEPPRVAPKESAPVPARRILIADDNRDSADSFARLFRLGGHEVETAYDGPEAVDAAERFRPDVVFLDIGMPRLNGYEVCRQIRSRAWGKEIVLIAHTGWGEDRQAEEAGFDGHVTKPADYTALTRLLASLPGRPRSVRPYRPARTLEGALPGDDA
jgi:signal transduction histidine kinase/ActR/RegA family two-component response regulator